MAFSPSELLRLAGGSGCLVQGGSVIPTGHPKPKNYSLAKKSNYLFRSDYIAGGIFPKIAQCSPVRDVPSPLRKPRPPINPVAERRGERRERERERETGQRREGR